MHREPLDKQRAQEIHLGGEVVEEQPLGHTCSASDAGGGSRVEAVCGKEGFRSVKNALTRLATAHNLTAHNLTDGNLTDGKRSAIAR